MRFILILLVFLTLKAKAQNEETISWDIILTIESTSNDSNFIEKIASMKSMLRANIRHYFRGNQFVSVATYDSLNSMRSVHLYGENFLHTFYTLDGITSYKKIYHTDVDTESSNSNNVPQVKFIENKVLGPFKCVVNEIYDPEKDIRIRTTSTHDIKSFYKLLSPMPFLGMEDIGFPLEIESETIFYKMNVKSSNFKTGEVDTAIFSISTEGIGELDWLGEMKFMKVILGDEYPIPTKEEDIPVGEGDYNDLYLKMCEDDNLSYCDLESLDLKPSYDKISLIGYVKSSKSDPYELITKKKIDEIFLYYDLLTKKELTSFNKLLNKIDKNLVGGSYIELIQFLKEKKMLESKDYRKILITNLASNNYKSKNPNHPEAKEFINGVIGWKPFLSSYQGIYDLECKKIIDNELEFLNEIKSIIEKILPEFSVSINEQKSEIQIKRFDLSISYLIESEYAILDGEYDNDGNIIKANKTKYDFESYSKDGLLTLLRQIGADYDLEMVFDYIKANSVLSHNMYDEKYKEIDLFQGELFLCIDKISSGESFMKDIPFTKTEYNEERDNLSSIRSFYASNAGISYVPLYQKEKLLKLVKENRFSIGVDSTFDINNWFSRIKNQQYDNVGLLLQSVPNLGVVVSTSALNDASYNKYGKNYENIFPKLYQLFGNDFLIKDVVLKCEELSAELSFKFFEKTHVIKSDIFQIEIDLLKKAIQLLKENNLYQTKKVYQSVEYLSDVNTKKLFYLSKETQKVLYDEFELPLIEFRN